MPARRQLQRQLAFVRTADRLKLVLRRGRIMSGGRLENSAEHSWHLALMVVALHRYARRRFNLNKAVLMALVHDLPEIFAGDTFIYDTKARARKQAAEARGAARVFGLLPRSQGAALKRLWLEYERNRTPEARFVRVVDRLQPLMSNALNKGYSWRKHRITARQVNALNVTWKADAPPLGDYADFLIRRAVRRGHLAR